MENIDTRHLYKKTDSITLSLYEDPEKIVNMKKKYLTQAEEEIAQDLNIDPQEVIIDIPEELSYKKMSIQVETPDGLKALSEVSTIIQSLKKAQYNYADVALFMSEENKQKAINKNIKIDNYLNLPV